MAVRSGGGGRENDDKRSKAIISRVSTIYHNFWRINFLPLTYKFIITAKYFSENEKIIKIYSLR